MELFPDTQITKLTQDEIKNLSRSIRSKDTKSIIKITSRKIQDQVALLTNFTNDCKYLKRN